MIMLSKCPDKLSENVELKGDELNRSNSSQSNIDMCKKTLKHSRNLNDNNLFIKLTSKCLVKTIKLNFIIAINWCTASTRYKYQVY